MWLAVCLRPDPRRGASRQPYSPAVIPPYDSPGKETVPVDGAGTMSHPCRECPDHGARLATPPRGSHPALSTRGVRRAPVRARLAGGVLLALHLPATGPTASPVGPHREEAI